MIPEPPRLAHLPHDKHHRPIPWFVAWINGKPDFRVMTTQHIHQATTLSLCWICGIPFQRQEDRVFVLGPHAAAHQICSEPPSHRDCAIYAATTCPFLTTPNMTRRARRIPAGAHLPPGTDHGNPGITVVWVAAYRAWKPITSPNGEPAFTLGQPKEVLWYTHGRPATPSEIRAAGRMTADEPR
jgi:hypothetical protein